MAYADMQTPTLQEMWLPECRLYMQNLICLSLLRNVLSHYIVDGKQNEVAI